ncbi:MAG: ribosome silencing factor [Flavobacteriales bacterium]|nr:ribosome silencing factor [Flavobacteriales bacterium]MCX7650033.1 ribosome silencing factor [Flavobacteriales bacterium]MDW8432355.1 ribosome silencing factor [Flavobacteriales bacterium]
MNFVIQDNPLLSAIIKGLEDKKARDIVVMHTGGVATAVWDYFVICSGDSTTQVQALADNVAEETRRQLSLRPHHIEGLANSEWVLLDYDGVAVHIFLPDRREFYGLEYLWADVPTLRLPSWGEQNAV